MNDTTAQVEDRLRALTDALLSVDQALSRAAEQPEVDLTEEIAGLRDAAGRIRTIGADIPDPRIRQWTHQLSTDLSALIARAVIERGGGGSSRMNLCGWADRCSTTVASPGTRPSASSAARPARASAFAPRGR